MDDFGMTPDCDGSEFIRSIAAAAAALAPPGFFFGI
jgi:hypothetical protein